MTVTNNDVSLFVGTRTRCNCDGCNTHKQCEFVGEPFKDADSGERKVQLFSYCEDCISVHPFLDQLQRSTSPSFNDAR